MASKPKQYEVVDSRNGYTVSGQMATKAEAQAWLEQRAKDMGKSVHEYHIKEVK